MEIYVYGTGCGAGALIDEALPAERVAAFVQTVPEADTFLGRPVVSPEQLAERKVDLIIVTTQDAAGVERRLDRLGIPAEARFYLKNSVAVRDRNERCAAAREALGDTLVDRLRRQYAVVRVPLWDDAAAPVPEDDWVRRMTLRAVCAALERVPGAAAELGVYRGGFAAELNALLPERTLYLFDTFSGFDPAETAALDAEGFLAAHRETSEAAVRARLPHPERAVFRAGRFPETAAGLEAERFAVVSLDADLEESTLAGLRWFVPRMAPGGCLLLHDWNHPGLPGVRAALERYRAESGRPLPGVPLCDVGGTLALPF